jgi:site-specific DNA recombinase
MDDTRRVALYARVSSQRQADEATIHSQVAALEQRLAADGYQLDPELRFLDEGYSGATVQRPALERLRDLIHAGGVERLYVHSPDRLARKFVHQAVLLEEFQRRHVEVVFLNHSLADASPEGNLLLQMQGMIAEYERAKILERTRRGRRFSARQGQVSVLAHAPYGYRYVCKHDGGGLARYDIVPEEARVVRDLFSWVGLEGLSLGEVVQRLTAHAVPTRTGRPRWDRATVRGILLNPAYYGEAHYGKTRLVERPAGRRPGRGRPAMPQREKVQRPTPPAEHAVILVPALVSQELFRAVGERLEENRRRQRTQRSGPQFLLSGLLVCGRCGSAYCGRHSRQGKKRYVYYRCLGTDKYRHGGEALCRNAAVSAALEDEIWADVCGLLRDPERVREELQRRRQPPSATGAEKGSLRKSIARLKRQLARLLDLYTTEYLDKAEFEARAQRVKERLACEEQAHAEEVQAEQGAAVLGQLVGAFEKFAQQVAAGLEQADFATKRQLLRLLIKQIEVGEDRVQIVYKVQLHPFVPSPDRGDLQHCLQFHATPSA